MRKKWIVRFNQTHQEQRSRLICFPHAGGGSTCYKALSNAISSECDVVSVVLPGRESRITEQPFTDIETIIPPLFEALESEMQEPFSLFGHSYGSILAFEMARKASSLGLPIRSLIVSGRRSAHLGRRELLLHKLPPQEFMAAIRHLNGTPDEILKDEAMMSLFLPCLKADLQTNEMYSPLTGRMLQCPVHAIMGRDDTEVNESELLAWRELTSGLFSHTVLEGGHFYLQTHFKAFVQQIRALISESDYDLVSS